MTGSLDVGNAPIHFPGDQFGRCFETPLKPHPEGGREAAVSKERLKGLLSMRPN
jgi:hypothetical protein